MGNGDGLVVRIRPHGGAFSLALLLSLCDGHCRLDALALLDTCERAEAARNSIHALDQVIGVAQAGRIERTALILVGAVLAATDFRDCALYDATYQRRYRGRS